jgi:hypothetical protein
LSKIATTILIKKVENKTLLINIALLYSKEIGITDPEKRKTKIPNTTPRRS